MRLYALTGLLSAMAMALPADCGCGSSKPTANKPVVALQQASAELKFGEWLNCGDSAKDAYAIQDVYVSQYMGTASVHIFGKVNRDITEGATILTALTMGKWPINVQKVDFCEFLEQQPVAPKCPLKAGHMNMTLQLSIPANMPPASYSLQSIIQTADEESVACLQGGFSVPAF